MKPLPEVRTLGPPPQTAGKVDGGVVGGTVGVVGRVVGVVGRVVGVVGRVVGVVGLVVGGKAVHR